MKGKVKGRENNGKKDRNQPAPSGFNLFTSGMVWDYLLLSAIFPMQQSP